MTIMSAGTAGTLEFSWLRLSQPDMIKMNKVDRVMGRIDDFQSDFVNRGMQAGGMRHRLVKDLVVGSSMPQVPKILR